MRVLGTARSGLDDELKEAIAIGGQAVPGYLEEFGRASGTETFVAMRAHIDNWLWSGVPFYLRTGKRMPSRCTEIYLLFRAVPHSIFARGGAATQPNALIIKLQPEERIEMQLMHKTSGLDRSGLRLSQVSLGLYLDAIEGNGTLYVRRSRRCCTRRTWSCTCTGVRDDDDLGRAI